jgi:amidase
MDSDLPSWQTISADYRKKAASKIPVGWRLSPSIISTISEHSTHSVLDIPRSCGILTAEEIDITEKYDAVTLIDFLATGKITSLAVTTAFCKRAAIAQQLVRTLPS